jgi:hypothetical protein
MKLSMVITEDNKRDHYDWLRRKLCSRSDRSWIKPEISDNTLHLVLKFTPAFGIKKDLIPPFSFKDSQLAGLLVFWEFEEEWTYRKKHYSFSRLCLRIKDQSKSEILCVHWTSPCPPCEPYQPHWHFSFDREGYYLNRLHVPLNHYWDKYYPENLDVYHKWLEGLLQFLESEFPRCLR